MQLAFRTMNAQDAQSIAAWHYPAPYAFYDWTADPDDLAELLDPQSWGRWYHAACDKQGDLVGFLSLREDHGTVLIGLGLRPDLKGRGHGLAFLLRALDFARARFADVTF
jgi:[ribosomal protein S18]-alanine N-acetyltransferase